MTSTTTTTKAASEPSSVPPGLTPHILPGILRQVAEIAGMQAAMDLCAAARGACIYFPSERLGDDCELVKAVGRDAALLIARELGGEEHWIPTCRPILRAYRARALRSAGYSTSQIAMILDTTRGNITRVAPSSQCRPELANERVIQAILDDAPRRFADMKPNGVKAGGIGRARRKAD